MTVAGIVAKLKKRRCGNALGAVALKAHAQGKIIRLGKACADALTRNDIRVLLQKLHRIVAVKTIQPYGDGRTNGVVAKMFDQAAQRRLLSELIRNLRRLFRADALYLHKSLRLVFDYLKRFCAKLGHKQRRRCRSNALDSARCEKFIDFVCADGHTALRPFSLELLAVHTVLFKAAVNAYSLAGAGKGQTADNGYRFSVHRFKLDDGIAVFLVLEQNRLYRTRYFYVVSSCVHRNCRSVK